MVIKIIINTMNKKGFKTVKDLMISCLENTTYAEMAEIMCSSKLDVILSSEVFTFSHPITQVNTIYYDIGLKPEVISNGTQQIEGCNIYPPLHLFLEALTCAYCKLTEQEFNKYITKLADLLKHQDHLHEITPILRLNPNISIKYELQGLGQGNHEIDWCIGPIGNRYILLEVKTRKKTYFL